MDTFKKDPLIGDVITPKIPKPPKDVKVTKPKPKPKKVK